MSEQIHQTGFTNKKIPLVLSEEINKALSFYPELVDTPIRFQFRQRINGSVMQAQPVLRSFFTSRRAYQINISALFRLTHAAVPIHQLPPEILIGWIGHELGHIMDYENRSVWGMIRFGLGYLVSLKYVKRAERVADTYAVNHGLGSYIIATKHYILDHTSLPDKYKQKIARLYLSPDDIVEQVRALEEGLRDSKIPGHK
ncbi:MAG TPA: hypothetical protein VGN64_17715 [Dyadobacter sp.]|jgi:hypothetical protein|nr:hypothetical protein [Dyadobacter sp.]